MSVLIFFLIVRKLLREITMSFPINNFYNSSYIKNSEIIQIRILNLFREFVCVVHQEAAVFSGTIRSQYYLKILYFASLFYIILQFILDFYEY